MTSLIEKIVAKLCPHFCFGCGIEDNMLCEVCLESRVLPLEPICFLCGKPSADWQPCAAHGSPLTRVWLASEYSGLVENLMHAYKFEHSKAAAEPLASLISRTLPYDNWDFIVPIPTATNRIRQRGYDQTLLLGRAIAANRGTTLSPALERLHNARQVGANRVQRQKQSIKMFSVAPQGKVRGVHILLVDDVCTTGATLNAAAHVLRAAGAAEVSAVAAAWQPPKVNIF